MNKIISIETYTPDSKDKFFFDTNIWMYFYCPIGGYNKDIIKKYDSFFKKILQSKATIYVSSLILSEFFNSYARLEFNISQLKNPDKFKNYKKDFRNTTAYEKIMAEIKATVSNRILKSAKKIDDHFSTLDNEKWSDKIETSDFNDKYYLAIAEVHNMKIVTHDADFYNYQFSNVPILTANKKITKGH